MVSSSSSVVGFIFTCSLDTMSSVKFNLLFVDLVTISFMLISPILLISVFSTTVMDDVECIPVGGKEYVDIILILHVCSSGSRSGGNSCSGLVLNASQ